MLRKNWAAGRLALVVVLMALNTGFTPNKALGKGVTPEIRISTVAVAELPVQGRNMVKLIYRGGPFRYDKDGSVFGNRESFLAVKKRGFYREYTVETPGERSRGARRIVCGGLVPAAPDVCYYTDDHYASFRRIVK
jgi:ribonuclease T1